MTTETSSCSDVRIPMPWGHVAGRWYGDQMRRPILALHGWLDNCDTFITLAPLLVPHCSLLCIDLPGLGHSSHLPVGTVYNRHYYVMLILRIMDLYKWEKVSLLGHSMDGSAAFDFACYHPKLVDLVISIDILDYTMMSSFDSHLKYLPYAMERAITENERLVHRSVMSEPPIYTFEELEKLLFKATNKAVNLDKCKYLLQRNITRSSKYPAKYHFSRDNRLKTIYSTHMNLELTREMTTRLIRAQMPYLVIKAADSQEWVNSIPLLHMLRAENPNFECHEFPDETHYIHLNNPEPVAKFIIAFLQKHPQEEPKPKKGATAKL